MASIELSQLAQMIVRQTFVLVQVIDRLETIDNKLGILYRQLNKEEEQRSAMAAAYD